VDLNTVLDFMFDAYYVCVLEFITHHHHYYIQSPTNIKAGLCGISGCENQE